MPLAMYQIRNLDNIFIWILSCYHYSLVGDTANDGNRHTQSFFLHDYAFPLILSSDENANIDSVMRPSLNHEQLRTLRSQNVPSVQVAIWLWRKLRGWLLSQVFRSSTISLLHRPDGSPMEAGNVWNTSARACSRLFVALFASGAAVILA